MKVRTYRIGFAFLASVLALVPSLVGASSNSFIGQFNTVSTLASTVPANGDVNPYGVAVVPRTVGSLTRGNILVSNFNNGTNLQGTGTTIMQITPGGARSVFAHIDASHLPGACPGGVGLTTALVVLRSGWVIVGSLPTTDGTSATAKAGCLLVLNRNGHVVETFSGGPINGPWDMTAFDRGDRAALFVTNVLNKTVERSPNVVRRGTVVRIVLELDNEDQGNGNGAKEGERERMPQVQSMTVIGSGFGERTDPAALVIGPTGLGLSANGTLYVADSLANRIAAIPNALFRHESARTGRTVSENGALNDPLGLSVAPNGDILTVNGNDGFIVETTPDGSQIDHKLIDNTGDPPGAGALFGLAVVPNGGGIYFVDDATNTLNLLH